ncbi:MAG: GNAT family N-acetyltransferase [Elusimicrobiota bacterium]
MNKQQQKEYLVRIIEGAESLVIPIHDDNGADIGTLRPITKMHLQSNDVIEKMTNWRNQYKVFFLSQFTATPARTKQWLEKVVLSNPSQLLFLIYCGATLTGQYGFKDLDGDSAFLDNLLRGERGGHPMLMKYAVSALAKWLFDAMQVNMVYGYTFANNAMALKLNRDVGFSCTEKFPLQKQIVGNEVKWVIGKAGEPSPDNHYYQKIVMTRNSKM